MTRVSQCSAGSHKPRRPGATPGPATCWKDSEARYANRKSGQVESLVCVGSSPTLVILERQIGRWLLIVGHWLFEESRLFQMINDQRSITNDQSFRSRRLTAKAPGLHPGDGGSIPSGTTARRVLLGGQYGPVVQWEDACLASKRSGFDSRWVHFGIFD